MPVENRKAFRKNERMGTQHAKRDAVHISNKGDNQGEGPKLVRDGKNGTERGK